jgi:hypothetical protein
MVTDEERRQTRMGEDAEPQMNADERRWERGRQEDEDEMEPPMNADHRRWPRMGKRHE